jgi:integrase
VTELVKTPKWIRTKVEEALRFIQIAVGERAGGKVRTQEQQNERGGKRDWRGWGGCGRGTLQKACKATGMPYGRAAADGFLLHDLRHGFNTSMRKAGVAESAVMEVTGHSTSEMFDRYNTVDAEDTRNALDQTSSFLRNLDQATN